MGQAEIFWHGKSHYQFDRKKGNYDSFLRLVTKAIEVDNPSYD
jgi:hypothetical protein